MTKYIRIDVWPTDYVRAAYKDGRFIEAIQVLHAWMESRLQQILRLQRTKLVSFDAATYDRAYDAPFELSLNNTAKALFIAGAIPGDLFDRILSFNRIRNASSTSYSLNPLKRNTEAFHGKNDAAYKCGLKVCDLLETIEDELVG